MTRIDRIVSALLGAIAAVLVVSWHPAPGVDREGYYRDRSLMGALFPQVETAYRASIIKSLQYGTITNETNGSTTTATITSVDTNNAFVFSLGESGGAGGGTTFEAVALRISLTNATTVTSQIQGNGSAQNNVISFVAVECWPGVIKSLQQITKSLAGGATSGTVTITSVVATKSALFPQGSTASSDSVTSDRLVRATLTNATTVTYNRQTSTGSVVGADVVVEFRG